MKKLINIIFAVMASCAMLSCGSDVEIPEKPDTPVTPEKPEKPEEPEDPGFGGDVTFTATIESLSDGSQPAWKKGESISIFDGTSTVKSANTEADGPVAKFPATIKKGTESVFALYPANDGVQLNSTGVLLDIPVEQGTASPVPTYRVAKGKSDLLYFRNLVAVLNLSVGFDGVTSVVIKADEAAKIAGTLSVDYSGESPVLAASSSQIEIKGEFQKDVVYPVVLAPATLTKCSVEAYVGDKVIAQIDLSGQTLKPGTVMEMPSMAPANPIYKITHLWMWGGTGPEWGCTAVYDLFDKKDYFDDEDGRGVEALKDNYLQFNSDGTFRNWAGADGRNWWHVYNSAKNPETGQKLDLKGFFEKLPRSEASYTIDEESNVVFTLPDASTRTAKLLPAGTYEMPETNPALKVTIEKQALLFEITGGRDIWDGKTADGQRDSTMYIYTEYCKIAAHPRALFIEIEQMPDSFTVPAEAQTTDADYKYEPPTYSFNPATLPGVWNLYGNNKLGSTDENDKSYGIWVNGGSGSSAAFVSPIKKSWCWNDSIGKEIDNTLTISVTPQSENTYTGTIKWEAGPDGLFWDCIWKSTGQDLSAYFSPLPKGESAFQANLATGEIVIGDNLKPSFLLPGSHAFTLGKRIEIPSDCFGLGFHIMDPVPENTSALWTDVDRFVNAPLDYVIIFEKK